jgi:hypothetical protein
MTDKNNTKIQEGNLGAGLGISTFAQVEELFKAKGVDRIYVKRLSPRQDNDKNQVLLGSAGAKNVLNLFPAELTYRAPSTSTKKQNSKSGEPLVEMLLNFYWLHADGSRYHAKDAKIINYFQYPEARFSGFAKGCRERPDCMIRKNLHAGDYGDRILVMGANNLTRETYGLALTKRNDPVVLSFPKLTQSSLVPLLETHVIGSTSGVSPKDLLINEINAICGKWHPSVRLKEKDGVPEAFKGNQGAGFTLEALLNIPSNADKAPDKHGFEIKSFKKSGKISLMTPTADMGKEADLPFRNFMDAYGWNPVKDHRLEKVFNGTFRYRKKKFCEHINRTLMLDVRGYDPNKNEFDLSKEGAIYISLDDCDNGFLLSGWSFQKMLNSWNEKHASACYVEYEKRKYSGPDKSHDAEYRFTGFIFICEGTDILRYLSGIAKNLIYYDPAHDLTKAGKANQRPQWRITVSKKFEDQLNELYDSVTSKNLI